MTRAVMLRNRLLDDLIMNIQQPQHTGFIAAHLTAKADDVGEHDRGESPILSRALQCRYRLS